MLGRLFAMLAKLIKLNLFSDEFLVLLRIVIGLFADGALESKKSIL